MFCILVRHVKHLLAVKRFRHRVKILEEEKANVVIFIGSLVCGGDFPVFFFFIYFTKTEKGGCGPKYYPKSISVRI